MSKKRTSYTTEDLLKELKRLKESGTCSMIDPKFYEPWDWVAVEQIFKKDLSK